MRNSRGINLTLAAVFLAGAITSSAGTLIDVVFTGGSATSKTGFAATGVTSNDYWNTCIVNLGGFDSFEFVDGTTSAAGLEVANFAGAGTNGASDPMYGTYLYSPGTNITVTVTNLIGGTYNLYLYGHGASNDQNSVFQITVGAQSHGSEATTNGPGWLSPVWQEGVQYVEFTNVNVLAGQAITITVEPGAGGLAVLSGLQIASVGPPSPLPVILTQPATQAIAQGSTATFSVVAGGSPPLAYQWLFNGANLAAATNSSYGVTNAQPANAGNYSVIVTNAYGSVTSAVAALSVLPPLAALIDVAFNGGLPTAKVGFAAVGVTTNDYWNTGSFNSSGTELEFVDGTASGAGLTGPIASPPGVGYRGVVTDAVPDPMYGTYLWFAEIPNITVTVTNLIPRVYDFYVYGHGAYDNYNSIFEFTAGSNSFGSEATTNGPGWDSAVWQEGVQYVEFTNVNVLAGQTITIAVEAGASPFAALSGLQMASFSPPSEVPFIVDQPTNRVILQGSTATFSAVVVAGGTVPLTYQWLFDGTAVSGATNSSFRVTNAQSTNAGNYSVIVTNAFGSVTSAVAALNVLSPGAPVLIDVAFKGGLPTTKVGFAAVGVTTNDYWNTCSFDSSVTDLEFVDRTASGAKLTVPAAPPGHSGSYTDAASDRMYATYLFTQAGNIIATVTNLIAGVYDFYVYGHGNYDNYNSVFQLTAGSQSFGSEATTNGAGWDSAVWQEGVQYVEFTNVNVLAGQTITITVEPPEVDGYAVLSGLQVVALALAANGAPPIISASNQFANVDQEIIITNYAFSGNGPISFTLASNAPAGARITPDGIFRWWPTCEQGSSTNLITVWVTDSSNPPLSNSMTFSVTVGPCVEVSVGSIVVQAGQSTCIPVNLVATVGLTNLGFTLAYPAGFLTNWNITSSNSAVAAATAQTVDSSHALFNVGVQDGQVLLGSSVIGSICLGTLPGASAFVPLVIANIAAAASNNTPITNLIGQFARVVVIGPQPLLDASLGTNASRLLTLYGNPGASYALLSTTNLIDTNSWSAAGSVTLTNLFQVIDLGPATNRIQFFKAEQ